MSCENFISCEAVWPSLLTETGSEMANSRPQTPLSLTLSDANWGQFLESPETLQAIFGCRSSFCISRTEKIYVVKLHSPFSFCSLKSISKDGTISPQFHKTLRDKMQETFYNVTAPSSCRAGLTFGRLFKVQRS